MPGVTIILDEVTPLLERVRTAAQVRGLALVGARAVASLVKTHLYGLDAQRHRFGRHFYRQAGDSVTSDTTPQGGVVSITQTGFRQRLFGGTIVPGPDKQFLTIPAVPEAVGTRAGEWSGLKFAYAFDPKIGALRPALVRATPAAVKSSAPAGKLNRAIRQNIEIGDVVFWLVRKVEQEADPTVLPESEQMATTAVGAIKTRIERLQSRSAGPTN